MMKKFYKKIYLLVSIVALLGVVGIANMQEGPDSTPPIDITDFIVASVTATSATLTWTAPGDDGNVGTAAIYDIRYSTTAFDPLDGGASWANGTQVVGEPVPSISGTAETMTVTGLSQGTLYYFAIKTKDEASNESGMAQDWKTTLVVGPESIPPAKIADLTASDPTATSAVLTWTAPGDDGNTGTASQYDIRYSTEEWVCFEPHAWEDMGTQVTGEPAPLVAGTSQSMTVTGLSPATTYYFAIRAADEVPNWSSFPVAADSCSTAITTLAAVTTADVYVDPATTTVNIGDTFDINVAVDPRQAIGGAQMKLTFNPSVLKINSITEGNLFKQSGASTFFIAGAINNTLGTVGVSYTAILGPGAVSTSGTFIKINATALGTGTSGINLSDAKVVTKAGAAVPLAISNGTVTVPATLSISDASATVNGVANVAITLTGMNNFGVANIDVYYDQNVVNIDPDNVNLGFSGYGGNLTTNVQNSIGKARFLILTSAIPGPNSPLTLVNVGLKAMGAAGQTTTLRLDVVTLADTDGASVTSLTNNGTFTISQPITGDLNSDGKVNSLDYNLLVSKWFQTTDIALQDLNKDGKVNVRDLGIMMSNWKE